MCFIAFQQRHKRTDSLARHDMVLTDKIKGIVHPKIPLVTNILGFFGMIKMYMS